MSLCFGPNVKTWRNKDHSSGRWAHAAVLASPVTLLSLAVPNCHHLMAVSQNVVQEGEVGRLTSHYTSALETELHWGQGRGKAECTSVGILTQQWTSPSMEKRGGWTSSAEIRGMTLWWTVVALATFKSVQPNTVSKQPTSVIQLFQSFQAASLSTCSGVLIKLMNATQHHTFGLLFEFFTVIVLDIFQTSVTSTRWRKWLTETSQTIAVTRYTAIYRYYY